MSKPLLLSLLLVACGSSSPAPDGKRLFADKQCDACHSIDGTPRIGPSLEGTFGKRVPLEHDQEVAFDEAYFVESVLDPSAKLARGYADVQPAYRGHVDDAEMQALIAYVKTLQPAVTGTDRRTADR